MRYSSYDKIQYFSAQVTGLQRSLFCGECTAAATAVSLQNTSPSPHYLHMHDLSPSPPFLHPLAITSLLSVSLDLPILNISYGWNRIICGFCVWRLSLNVFWVDFMLQRVTALRSFLWLSNIPLYGYTTFYLSVYQLMDIWVISILWFLGTFVCKFLWEHKFLILLVELVGHVITLYLSEELPNCIPQ